MTQQHPQPHQIEWELSKENVHPIRKGRRVATLNEGLVSVQNRSHMEHLLEEKDAMERQLEDAAPDDAFQVHIKYLKFVEQHFPSGAGKEFRKALETCISRFLQDPSVQNHPDWLECWRNFAELSKHCGKLAIYEKMLNNDICTGLADFYILYANALENLDHQPVPAGKVDHLKSQRILEIFNLGLNKCAQPIDRLMLEKRRYEDRLARCLASAGATDSPESPEETQRFFMTQLKGVKKGGHLQAPVDRTNNVISRNAPVVSLAMSSSNASSKSKQFGLDIHEDLAPECSNTKLAPRFAHLESGAPRPSGLGLILPTSGSNKENQREASVWTNQTVHKSNSAGKERAGFQIYTEEEQALVVSSQQKSSVGRPSSSKIARKENSSMGYTRHLVMDDDLTDISSFEELRAARWFSKHGRPRACSISETMSDGLSVNSADESDDSNFAKDRAIEKGGSTRPHIGGFCGGAFTRIPSTGRSSSKTLGLAKSDTESNDGRRGLNIPPMDFDKNSTGRTLDDSRASTSSASSSKSSLPSLAAEVVNSNYASSSSKNKGAIPRIIKQRQAAGVAKLSDQESVELNHSARSSIGVTRSSRPMAVILPSPSDQSHAKSSQSRDLPLARVDQLSSSLEAVSQIKNVPFERTTEIAGDWVALHNNNENVFPSTQEPKPLPTASIIGKKLEAATNAKIDRTTFRAMALQEQAGTAGGGNSPTTDFTRALMHEAYAMYGHTLDFGDQTSIEEGSGEMGLPANRERCRGAGGESRTTGQSEDGREKAASSALPFKIFDENEVSSAVQDKYVDETDKENVPPEPFSNPHSKPRRQTSGVLVDAVDVRTAAQLDVSSPARRLDWGVHASLGAIPGNEPTPEPDAVGPMEIALPQNAGATRRAQPGRSGVQTFHANPAAISSGGNVSLAFDPNETTLAGYQFKKFLGRASSTPCQETSRMALPTPAGLLITGGGAKSRGRIGQSQARMGGENGEEEAEEDDVTRFSRNLANQMPAFGQGEAEPEIEGGVMTAIGVTEEMRACEAVPPHEEKEQMFVPVTNGTIPIEIQNQADSNCPGTRLSTIAETSREYRSGSSGSSSSSAEASSRRAGLSSTSKMPAISENWPPRTPGTSSGLQNTTSWSTNSIGGGGASGLSHVIHSHQSGWTPGQIECSFPLRHANQETAGGIENCVSKLRLDDGDNERAIDAEIGTINARDGRVPANRIAGDSRPVGLDGSSVSDDSKDGGQKLLRPAGGRACTPIPSDVEDDEVNERTGFGFTSRITSDLDPFSPAIQAQMLLKSRVKLECYANFHYMPSPIPKMKTGFKVEIGGEYFNFQKLLGEGAFAEAYLCTTDDESLDPLCLKVQKPSCPWEFYIGNELVKRLKIEPTLGDVGKLLVGEKTAAIMLIQDYYLFDDGSVIVNQFHSRGTLLTFVNKLVMEKRELHESVVIYLLLEMLTILSAFHKVGIIHGDVKPDNFLLRALPPSITNSAAELFGRGTRCLKLIDFGRSIDMKLIPRGKTFRGTAATSSFCCPEMTMGRDWTYQTDYFGILASVHVLLFRTYMKFMVRENRDGEKVVVSMSTYKRRWNRDLWQNLFHTFLNIPSCNQLPDISTQSDAFRRHLEDWLSSAMNVRTWNQEVDGLRRIMGGE